MSVEPDDVGTSTEDDKPLRVEVVFAGTPPWSPPPAATINSNNTFSGGGCGGCCGCKCSGNPPTEPRRSFFPGSDPDSSDGVNWLAVGWGAFFGFLLGLALNTWVDGSTLDTSNMGRTIEVVNPFDVLGLQLTFLVLLTLIGAAAGALLSHLWSRRGR